MSREYWGIALMVMIGAGIVLVAVLLAAILRMADRAIEEEDR